MNYHEANPVVSFRLPKSLKQALEKVSQNRNKNINQYCREIIETSLIRNGYVEVDYRVKLREEK